MADLDLDFFFLIIFMIGLVGLINNCSLLPFWFLLFSQDFQGFLNDLQDWDLTLKDKDKKMRPQASDKEISVIWIWFGNFYLLFSTQIWNAVLSHIGLEFVKVSSSGKTRVAGEARKRSSGPYDYARSYDAINSISSSLSSEDGLPDAASEKELVGVVILYSM